MAGKDLKDSIKELEYFTNCIDKTIPGMCYFKTVL